MSKLYSSDYIIKTLKKRGFVFISQRGSHIKLKKLDKSILTVIVPANKREIPIGTFRSILRQANLIIDDFE